MVGNFLWVYAIWRVKGGLVWTVSTLVKWTHRTYTRTIAGGFGSVWMRKEEAPPLTIACHLRPQVSGIRRKSRTDGRQVSLVCRRYRER